MEGTSGAAACTFLRGTVHKAALLETKRKRVSGTLLSPRDMRTRWVDSVLGWASPAHSIPSSRQEVSEPIGLGRSSPRAQARGEALDVKARATTFRPLTRDHSVSRLRKESREPCREFTTRAKAQGVAQAGVSAVPRSCLRSVSIAEVDGRRAAPGARGRELAEAAESSPSSCSEGRKSVGSRPRTATSRGTVAGPRSSRSRKRSASGHPSREGASSRESPPF
jgi:hypothetical protein